MCTVSKKSSFYFLIIFNKTGTYKMYILATNEHNETKKFNNYDINNALYFAGKNGKLVRFYK